MEQAASGDGMAQVLQQVGELRRDFVELRQELADHVKRTDQHFMEMRQELTAQRQELTAQRQELADHVKRTDQRFESLLGLAEQTNHRLAALERHAEHVDRQIGEMRKDLKDLKDHTAYTDQRIDTLSDQTRSLTFQFGHLAKGVRATLDGHEQRLRRLEQ